MPGRIIRLPGGVALNIGMALARFGLKPALISAVGRDAEGDELIRACDMRGLITSTVYRSDDLPTDTYMAVEGSNGLIAAIADAHSLEAAGGKILRPFTDGTLPAPYTGAVALDGNLTLDLLSQMAKSPLMAGADLRVAPASPGKALRTNGGAPATLADTNGAITQTPPAVHVARVTGAGDTFMAAHIAAELKGQPSDAALAAALQAAAFYVSGETRI